MTPDDVNETIGENISEEVSEMTDAEVFSELMRLDPFRMWRLSKLNSEHLEQQRIHLTALLVDEYNSRY